MLHIYRQISGLARVRPIVIAQKRENAGALPFEPVYTVGKPATHFLRRFWFRQLLDQPWQISRMELESLLALLDRTGAELLHIYFGHIAVHLLPLIRAWPHPVVVSFHGADVLVELEKPAYRRATQEMLKHVRQVFVRSESLGRAIAGLDCEKEKIKLVRTGIPLDRFPFRPRHAPDGGRWQLLQAGRLIEKKGIATSLRAFAQFSQTFPEATLIIAGDGPLLYELEDLADSLRIHDRVSFRGFVSQDQLRDLYYASHIFLHPSQTGRDGNQEGVPNSMLEAMATGLPVFATNHGGIPEAIENGASGALVPERDHEALADALLRATKDPQALARFGRAGAEAVAQKFDQRAQVQHLEDLYLEIIRASE
jgi:colanic acid/amylovoran biosynthesis glycosyltransferase